ncbi:hypothetical protein LJC74_07510 [Eubacteriales bacterium OttesenSCG-928-A19]|nr:hypothetical protein [Eubacteriales bacterium OttesenSCG-928-A19]
MKIKQGVRYYLHDYSRSVLIFYVVIATLIVINFVLRIFLRGASGGMSGMESATAIFLLVVGLNSFKTPFGLFLQNGVSRRTLWVDFLISAAILSVGMAVVDTLYGLLLTGTLRYTTMFATMYLRGVRGFSAMGLLWSCFANFTAMTFGFFVTTLYYRMNRPLKLLVSIGVPLLFFVVLPMVEVFVPTFTLFTSLIKLVSWAFGLNYLTPAPWHAIGTFTVLSAAMAGLSFLLVRTATLKSA